MKRIYGDEQRASAKKIRMDLISKLESIYLTTFDQLNESGFGEGMVIKLTQIILLSRDGALNPLQEEIEGRKKL